MALRFLGWIAMLTLASGCSLIFKDAPRAQDDAGIEDDAGQTCTTEAQCQPNQACEGGLCVCDATSCAAEAGCCGADDLCHTITPTSCGLPGEECSSCDEYRANNCDIETGECACDDNPICKPGLRCEAGGTGRCACDIESCPTGCCIDVGGVKECVNTATECGTGCFDCTDGGSLSETCEEGSCSGCAAACNGDGCCSNGTECIPATTNNDPATCGGITGAACQACGITADRCNDAGECECTDTGGACDSGQACEDGECVCTLLSCTDGCCDPSGNCVKPGVGDDICDIGAGVDGLCMMCPPGELCNGMGACRCDPIKCSELSNMCCNDITGKCESSGMTCQVDT